MSSSGTATGGDDVQLHARARALHSRSRSIVPAAALPKLKLSPSTMCAGPDLVAQDRPELLGREVEHLRRRRQHDEHVGARRRDQLALERRRTTAAAGPRRGRRTVSGCGSNVTTANAPPPRGAAAASAAAGAGQDLRVAAVDAVEVADGHHAAGGTRRRPSRPSRIVIRLDNVTSATSVVHVEAETCDNQKMT